MTDSVQQLIQGNAGFATHRFASGLKIIPSLKVFVIGCVDPRVDPSKILGLDLGEAAVLRNIGGRVTSSVLDELVLLRKLTQAAGGDFDKGWTFRRLAAHRLRDLAHARRTSEAGGVLRRRRYGARREKRGRPARRRASRRGGHPRCRRPTRRNALRWEWFTTSTPDWSSSRRRQTDGLYALVPPSTVRLAPVM